MEEIERDILDEQFVYLIEEIIIGNNWQCLAADKDPK